LVEQPIRNRQVSGSSPLVGSSLFRSLEISSPQPAAHLLHELFLLPVAFVESSSKNMPFVVDIYQQVAFLGDLHRQLSSYPEGTKVRLKIAP
jgi:hypothetical protein